MADRPTPHDIATNNQWGQLLNDHLAVSLNTDGTIKPSAVPGKSQRWTKLKNGASAGASTIVLDPVPSLFALLGGRILVDVGDNQFEYQNIAPGSINSITNTVTLPFPLDFSHSAGDDVYINYGNDSPINFTWCGGVEDNTDSAAIRNYGAFNRMAAQGGQAAARAGSVHLVIDGGFYVKGICKAQGNAAIVRGPSGYSRSAFLRARAGFPFDVAGNASILAIQDPTGAYSTWANGLTTADTTCTLYGFTLDANNLSDGICLVVEPQQPGFMRDLTLCNSLGAVCFAFGGQNYADLENIQIFNYALGLYISQVSGVTVRNTNITNPLSVGGVHTALRIGGIGVSIYSAMLETGIAPGPLVDLIGGASGIVLDSIFSSGFDASGDPGTIINVDAPGVNPGPGSTYDIRNFKCNQNSNTIKLLRDVQRNFSINSQSHIPDRYLSAKAGGSAAQYWGNSGWTAASSGVPQAA